MTETHKRTIVRTVVWRLIATCIIAIWAGWSGSIIANIILIILHYVHERLWLKVEWGKNAQ
jgi:uncharacterized membrane protein